ncbi:ABC transporter permease subunit [Streptomyces spororaveus]|uniref:ABC transporter permease subunit n=1 Tax=Streptomyces spororaveus TaxID=284039 RepID=UPI0037ADC86C
MDTIELRGLTKRYGAVVGVEGFTLGMVGAICTATARRKGARHEDAVAPAVAGTAQASADAGGPRALAAAAVAADVESGTIELVVVRPVSRNRLLAERTAAVVIAALALNAAATLTVAAGVWLSPDIHRDVPLSGVFAAGLMGCGFALCLAGPALAVSAWGSRRAQVIGATIAIGAVGFAVNFIALAWSKAAPLRFISPFHYYTPGDALAQGHVLWPQLVVLVGVGVVGLVLGHALLMKRDLAP